MKRRCEDCGECVYIDDGDYCCMKDVPTVVLTDYMVPTDDYCWCCRKEKAK